MDKSTLSNYGWVVIVTLVLSVMLAFATPFGSYVARATANVIKYYKTVTGDTFSADYIEGQSKEWEDYINETITNPEIEGNPRMYGIGKTKPEYVVAIFNEDYSEVRIVKNGVSSDGLMKNFKIRNVFVKPDLTNAEIDAAWKPHASPMQIHANTLKTAIIEEDVVSLGEYAFYSCTNLKDVTIAKTVKIIEPQCFMHCSSLTEIELPPKITEVSKYCFYSCKKLEKATIPDTVTSIGSCAFWSCFALKDVNIPKNCQYIKNNAFTGVPFTSVILPNGLLEIGTEAFSNTRSLKKITIPASITKIEERALSGANVLTDIEVAFDNPNYTVVDGVLYNKDKTLLLAFPGGVEGDSYTVEPTTQRVADHAFLWSKLEQVNLNDGLKEIGDKAFAYSNLVSLNIPASLNSIELAVFEKTYKFNEITVDNANTNFKIIDGGLYSMDETVFHCLPTLYVCDTFTMKPTVTKINDAAFSYTENVKTITISPNVTIIPQNCFAYSVAKVNLPSNYTRIEYWAFFGMPNLKEITIPETVTYIHESVFDKTILTAIKGKPNSKAQTYANTYGYNFVAI